MIRELDNRLIALILFVTPLVYWAALKDYTLGPKLLAWQSGLCILLVSFLVKRDSFRFSELHLPAAGYIGMAALSLFWSLDPVAGLLELLKLATGVITMLVIATRDPEEIEGALSALILAATLSAFLGLLQYLDALPWAIPSAGLPSGTLGFRNIAAMVTIQVLPFSVLLISRRPGTLWYSSLAILVGFLLQTRTRGAWVGCLVATLIVLVANRTVARQWITRKWKPLALAVVIGAVLGGLPPQFEKSGPQDIDEKKTSVSDAVGSILSEGGDRGRTTLWSRTVEMIVDQPFGVGLGNWPFHYPIYDRGSLVTDYGAPSKPHNDILGTTSELGVIGLAVFVVLLAVALRSSLSHRPGPHRGLALAALASVIAVVVHGLFSFPRDRATPTLVFWVALGILASLSRRNSESRFDKPAWVLSLAVVVVCAAFTSRVLAFESRLYNAAQAERRGNWAQVAEQTRNALEIGRLHTEPLHLRGYALNATGRYSQAVEHYSHSLTYRPHDVQVLNGFAIALQNTGDLAEAARTYRQARSLVAASNDIDYNLATLLIQMRKPAEAVPLLERLASSGNDDAGVLFHLGNARALSGDDKGSIEALTSAVSIVPDLAQAWMVLGEIYYRTGEKGETLNAFRKFSEYHKSDDVYRARALQMIEKLTNEVGDER